MNEDQEFSQVEYDYYWDYCQSLGPKKESQLLDSEETPSLIRAIILIQQGQKLAKQAKVEAAIANCKAALKIQPRYDRGWIETAKILRSLGNYQKALECCKKATELAPRSPIAWLERGNALIDLGNFSEADRSYSVAIDLDPHHATAWHNRGVALAAQGQYKAAIHSYDGALEIQPNYFQAWNNRGLALAELAQYEEALQNYDRALVIQPNYSQAWNNRGIILAELQYCKEAIQSYDKAIEIAPNYAEFWQNRGDALVESKRYEEALLNYEKALELKPDSNCTWCKRAKALQHLGHLEAAVRSYDQATGEQCTIDLFCATERCKILKENKKILPYLMNRWAKGKRDFWAIRSLTPPLFEELIIFLAFFFCLYLVILAAKSLLDFIQNPLLIDFIFKTSLNILKVFLLILTGHAMFSALKQSAGLPYKVYFRSGILSYIRAFLIFVTTIIVGITISSYSPSFLRIGWGELVFSNSGNWAVMQPFDLANQAAEMANGYQAAPSTSSPGTAPHDLQGAQSETEASSSSDKDTPLSYDSPVSQPEEVLRIPSWRFSFDFRWVFIPSIWLLFVLVLPTWAELEEKLFRQGANTWGRMTLNSLGFGLVHLTMGIPICFGLTLSVTGFLFACRYRYAYRQHLKKFGDEQAAQKAGVAASTADHAIYNAIAVTLIALSFLMGAW